MTTQNLRPYQAEAVEAITTALADGGNGQLHAACSSGKTLMAMRAAEHLAGPAGLVVVLAPTLSLVSQILDDWQEDAQVPFQRFAVCSDATAGNSGEDAIAFKAEDLHVPVSTDRDRIAKWLTAEGPRLIVATYLSAVALAAAVRHAGIDIDMLICDEAHHLAGRADTHTRRIMDPVVLPTRRRLYMTGTPRIGQGRDDEQRDTRTLSMDDETTFGPVLYTYSFSRGIEEGYLADYRIAVIGVTDQEVREQLNREDADYVDGIGLHTAAAQVALARAYEDYGLRRAITFHATIDDARLFTDTLPITLASLPDTAKVPVPTCLHLNGGMDGETRRATLEALKNPPGDGWAVASNVRCLSEGVDVPALDGVLFASPKKSTVDIVQAASRALRPHPDTPGMSTIIVPVVVPDADDEVDSVDPGAYEALFQILRALKEHDDVLSTELNVRRAGLLAVPICKPDGDKPNAGDDIDTTGLEHDSGAEGDDLCTRLSKVEFRYIPPRFYAELRLVVLRQTTSDWWERYAEACAFHRTHGHLKTDIDDFIHRWIKTQRSLRLRGLLSQERLDALDALDLPRHAYDHAWDQKYQVAQAFYAEHGHLLVPDKSEYLGVRLGAWVRVQRKRQSLTDEQRCRLDAIGMNWNPLTDLWLQGYEAACKFREANGHLRVPWQYVADDFHLGSWIRTCRKRLKRGSLRPEHKSALDDLGMVWDARGLDRRPVATAQK
jgi:predicted helicase